ncbi:unnamed protein product [Dibothriocephalus latus]|uniref:Arginine kinase n=1 Tax=Dibothriocephalus latus TaxID=60516 RepID=A0A3P7KVT4_DIBLA|nr:unnamed protein product [Dibothriocephalus latus]
MSAHAKPSTATKRAPEVESLESLVKMIQDCPESKCLAKSYLTTDFVKKMSSVKSEYGCTLAHIIRNCALNPKSECPRVGDADCYKVFQEFLDIVIKTYHKIPSDDFKHPEPTFGDLEKLPFGNLDPTGKNSASVIAPSTGPGTFVQFFYASLFSPVSMNCVSLSPSLGVFLPRPPGDSVVSTRVRVGRSIDGFPFSTIISKEDRLLLEQKLSAVLKGLTGEFAGTYHSLDGMDDETKDKLVKDHFLFGDSNKIFQDAGGYRDWPVGRGIFFNKDKTFLCWIGEEDHLRVISMQEGGDLAAVYARLARVSYRHPTYVFSQSNVLLTSIYMHPDQCDVCLI